MPPIVSGVDPELFRSLSSASGIIMHAMSWEAAETARFISEHELESAAGGVTGLCSEIAEEADLLSRLTFQKARQIEDASRGIETAIDPELFAQLLASVHDADGAVGPGDLHTDDPELAALLAELATSPDFAAAIEEKMREAARNGDWNRVHLLAKALMDQVEKLSEDDALSLLGQLDPSVVVIATEMEGMRNNVAVAKILALYVAWTQPPDGISDPLDQFIYDNYGVDGAIWLGLDEWAQQKLLDTIDEGGLGATAVFEAITWTNLRGRMKQLAPIAMELALKHPDYFNGIFANPEDVQWFADGLVAGNIPQQQINELLGLLLASIAEDDEEMELSRKLRAAAFIRALEATGHGISIDYQVLVEYALKKGIGQIDPSLLEAYELLDAMIVDDPVPGHRADETAVNVRRLNTSLVILSAVDPAAAAEIVGLFGEDEVSLNGLTEEQWAIVERRNPRGLNELKRINGELGQVYSPGENDDSSG